MSEPRKPGNNVCETPRGGGERKPTVKAHIDLGKEFFDYYAWSNHAEDLQLETYFDPQKPNLGDEFGLSGLQPVIRSKSEDTFLLKDANNIHYRRYLMEGSIFQLQTDKTESMEVAMLVMQGVDESKWLQQWNPATARRSED